MNQLAVVGEDEGRARATQTQFRRGDRIEDRSHIRRRTRDHAQDVAGRRLLLERFLRLVEKAHVLDRDGGLIGECFQQRDL